jgi:hypothetical protein
MYCILPIDCCICFNLTNSCTKHFTKIQNKWVKATTLGISNSASVNTPNKRLEWQKTYTAQWEFTGDCDHYDVYLAAMFPRDDMIPIATFVPGSVRSVPAFIDFNLFEANLFALRVECRNRLTLDENYFRAVKTVTTPLYDIPDLTFEIPTPHTTKDLEIYLPNSTSVIHAGGFLNVTWDMNPMHVTDVMLKIEIFTAVRSLSEVTFVLSIKSI